MIDYIVVCLNCYPPLTLDVRCGMFQIDSNHLLLAMNVTILSFILSYLTKRRQSCALSLP